MRFSVWPINQQPYRDLIDVCRHAEDTGWDGVWMSDHLLPSGPPFERPVLECWTTIAALLTTLRRVRVGSLVTATTFRHPVVVAKMAANLAALAPDRLVLGIGAGWQVNEHIAYGIDYPSAARRLAMLDEACTVIRRLLIEDVVDFAGAHYTLSHATISPRSPLPLLVGVKGARALAIAARHADEWNFWGSPDTVRAKFQDFDKACDQVGRDAGSVRRSAQALVCLTEADGSDAGGRWTSSGLPVLAGEPDRIRDAVGEYAAAGLDELIVPDFTLGSGNRRLDTMDLFIEQIAAPFRRSSSPNENRTRETT